MQPNFVRYVAERTVIPHGALLNICICNPLTDPYLTEISQDFQNGVARENLLIIRFPPLANFEALLSASLPQRARTAKSTQFVGTLIDFETMLMQLTSGLLSRLAFVFPVDDA